MIRAFKKQSAVLLAIMVMISGFMLSSSADTKLTFTVGNASCKAGEVVKVPVELKGNPGITGWNIWITYDKDVMELVSVNTDCDFKDSGSISKTEALDSVPYSVMCDNTNIFTTEGKMVEFSFQINNAASAGKYSVEFDTENTMATDADANPVEIALDNGTIEVKAAAPKPQENVSSAVSSNANVSSAVSSNANVSSAVSSNANVSSTVSSNANVSSAVSSNANVSSTVSSNANVSSTVSSNANVSSVVSTTSNASSTSRTSSKTSSTSASSTGSVSSPKTGSETPVFAILLACTVSAAAVLGLSKRKENN